MDHEMTSFDLGLEGESEAAASSIDLRRRQLGTVLRGLAADLVAERRRRLRLQDEVRKLQAKLEARERDGSGRGRRSVATAEMSEGKPSRRGARIDRSRALPLDSGSTTV